MWEVDKKNGRDSGLTGGAYDIMIYDTGRYMYKNERERWGILGWGILGFGYYLARAGSCLGDGNCRKRRQGETKISTGRCSEYANDSNGSEMHVLLSKRSKIHKGSVTSR